MKLKASTGVYKIEHTQTGRMYIGSAVEMDRRWSHHKWNLRKGEHPNNMLQNSWNKYGETSFKFEPLLVCSKEDRIFYEQLIMDNFRTHEKQFGFNIRKKAESNTGIKLSDAHKKAIGDRFRGIPIKSKTGDKYGKVTLIKFLEIRNRHHIWLLQCDCGKQFTADISPLRLGKTTGCGCSSKRRKSSLYVDHPLYGVWRSCSEKCKEWKNFYCFINSVGDRPKGFCLSRQNKEKPFSKDNFIWVSPEDLRGKTSRCQMILINGDVMNFSKACRVANIPYGSVWNYMKRKDITCQESFDRFIQKKVGIL